MCLFFKLKSFFLVDIIPKVLSTRTTRNHNDIRLFNVITTSLYLTLNINTFETLFFHALLISGKRSIIIFQIWNRLVLLKNKSLILSDQLNESPLRGCLHVKFHPGMKSSLSMVKCLLLFKRFCRDGISSPDERQGWNFILGWKKEKKTCKHFILGWNFKMSMFF